MGRRGRLPKRPDAIMKVAVEAISAGTNPDNRTNPDKNRDNGPGIDHGRVKNVFAPNEFASKSIDRRESDPSKSDSSKPDSGKSDSGKSDSGQSNSGKKERAGRRVFRKRRISPSRGALVATAGSHRDA